MPTITPPKPRALGAGVTRNVQVVQGSRGGAHRTELLQLAQAALVDHLTGIGNHRADNISMVFQPIWDVAACRILAYEALARPAREFGLSGPQDVFDLAERVGRSREIELSPAEVPLCAEAAVAGLRERTSPRPHPVKCLRANCSACCPA